MSVAAGVEQGRLAFERRAWAEAHAALAGATEPDDLERLAITAALLGKDADDVMERAHQAHLGAGDAAGAARCAFWLGIRLATTGEAARGGGWIARAHRVLGDLDAVEQGYLLIPAGRLQLDADPGAALEKFIEVVRVADRFGDPDLMALGLLGQGQSLLKLGRAPEGLALLDETMVAVESGEVATIPSGIIYCAVIASCQEISDGCGSPEGT